MDDQKLRTFNAIASFVQDLDTVFGKKYKPVALYNRLASKTTIRDVTSVDRHINAFHTFFDCNPDYIKSKKLTNNARIVYSDHVFLDIKRILDKTEPDAHKHISQHLITIYSLMNIGTQQGKVALETLKQADVKDVKEELDINLPDTVEGNFIKETLTEMTSHFDNMGEEANPMAMMSSMMQSGFFTKFMGDLQTKFSTGEMNINTLMGTVTNVISEATPEGGEEAAQIRNFVSQSMSQVSAMTGGGNLPTDVQDQMSTLLNAMTGGPQPPVEALSQEQIRTSARTAAERRIKSKKALPESLD